MVAEVAMLVNGLAHPMPATFDRRNPVMGDLATIALAATILDANTACHSVDAAFPV